MENKNIIWLFLIIAASIELILCVTQYGLWVVVVVAVCSSGATLFIGMIVYCVFMEMWELRDGI